MKSIVIDVCLVDEEELPSGENFCKTLARRGCTISAINDDIVMMIVMDPKCKDVFAAFERMMNELRNEIIAQPK